MIDIDKIVNSPDFMRKVEEFEKEHEEKMLKVNNADYFKWLLSYTMNKKNKCWCDEDAEYNLFGKDIENASLLSYFLTYVKGKAREQRVASCPEGESEVYNYVIELYDNYFEISLIFGQGSCIYFKRVEKPEFNVVKIA